MPEVILPLTSTGRKYGYIIWSKARETEVRKLLGGHSTVVLVLPSGQERHRTVDWKHRRVSVGYSVTRDVKSGAECVSLEVVHDGKVKVAFV